MGHRQHGWYEAEKKHNYHGDDCVCSVMRLAAEGYVVMAAESHVSVTLPASEKHTQSLPTWILH